MVLGIGKDKKKEEEEVVKEPEATPTSNSRLNPAVLRAMSSIVKTVDMFKDTVQDVLAAEKDSAISDAEVKDLVSRCKSYSLIVEKEFKIMRRRMASK